MIKMAKTIKIDGSDVTLGAFVGFKDGIEQSGKIVAINGSYVTLAVWDGVEGKYDQVKQHASRCWLD
jgi:hypothetical protein